MKPFIKRDISKLCLYKMDKRETIIDSENSTILGIYGEKVHIKLYLFIFITMYAAS